MFRKYEYASTLSMGLHDGVVTRSSTPRGRTGRPPVTSRAEILAAARGIIDTDGWEKLTIRRLAAEIGIGATTLYHHVRDREDLLIQLLNDHVARTMSADLLGAPRDRIVAATLAIHDSLSTWPWAAEVLTTDGFLGRLNDSALDMVEVVLSGAIEHGCSREQAVDVFRSLWYYTVGEILVRAHSRRRVNAPAPREHFFTDLDATRFPLLADVGDDWPPLAARDIYARGLAAFVDGLLARAPDGDIG
jgi:AcrR family transcriptional regulator